MSSQDFRSNSLFITLHYLRTVNKVNVYHWALFSVGPTAPKGYLLHATDKGRQASDLRLEVREVKDPRSLKTMVACLKLGNNPNTTALMECAASIPLMDLSRLPRGEWQWTDRVWVKSMLYNLVTCKHLRLPHDIDTIEMLCQQAADSNMGHADRARICNDLNWMTMEPSTESSDTRYDGTNDKYHRSKPTGGRPPWAVTA